MDKHLTSLEVSGLLSQISRVRGSCLPLWFHNWSIDIEWIVSYYDFSCEALKPWLEAGYPCVALDYQHEGLTIEPHKSGGVLVKVGADLSPQFKALDIPTAFAYAFPPCTHLSKAGSHTWKGKGKAAYHEAIDMIKGAALRLQAPQVRAAVLENPVGRVEAWKVRDRSVKGGRRVVARGYRKWDHKYKGPFEYSGYLQEEDERAPYSKETCLWSFGGYVHPPTIAGPLEGPLPALVKRGGKSLLTKNARSVTPIGWSRAVFAYNS